MQVHVEGVIRESEKPSSFVPENSPSKGEWYWVDVPAMARAAGLPPDTPLIEAKSFLLSEPHRKNPPLAFQGNLRLLLPKWQLKRRCHACARLAPCNTLYAQEMKRFVLLWTCLSIACRELFRSSPNANAAGGQIRGCWTASCECAYHHGDTCWEDPRPLSSTAVPHPERDRGPHELLCDALGP